MKTDGIKIRLVVDLTKYNPILVKGIEGVTLPKDYRKMDCYVDCLFNGVTIPVAPSGYEIIDEEYLAQVAAMEAQRRIEILSATSVIRRWGKRGGFQGLHITYEHGDGSPAFWKIGTREEANEIEQYLRGAGKTIEVKTEV